MHLRKTPWRVLQFIGGTAFFSVVTIFPAGAQKLDASKVPAVVKTSFAKKYPNVRETKWEKEDGNFEGSWRQGDQAMSAIFTPAGEFKEAEISIPVSQLPPAAITYVKEHYKGAAIKEGAKVTKASGEVNYEAEIKGSDIIFDANGKFLKTEKD